MILHMSYQWLLRDTLVSTVVSKPKGALNDVDDFIEEAMKHADKPGFKIEIQTGR